jgi:hypothetical protein
MQVTADVAEQILSPAPTKEGKGAASPADDQPEEPSDGKLELPPPRRLQLSHPGWDSDDTKTFEKDRGRGGETHTHTHSSLLNKVVSFLL